MSEQQVEGDFSNLDYDSLPGEEIDLSGYSLVPPGEDAPPETPDDVNAELRKMLEPARPDVPTIDDPPDGTAELLLGIEHNGKRYRSAIVRELNGVDEEAIARIPRGSTNYNVLIVDLHLRCAVVSVGPVVVEDNPDVLSQLIVPDRDILFKEILLATYGRTREFEAVPCPTCGFEMDLEIDIDGLVEITNPKTFDSDRFTVELRDGRQVLMKYVTGSEQLAVFSSKSKELSSPEANTAFISACVLKVDGKALADPEDWARKLGVADRRKLVTALLDVPAVGFKEVEVPCHRCGKNLPTVFGWADLLPN